MEPVAVDVIRTTDPMVILIARGRPSRNLLIRGAAYDTVHQRKTLPIQEIKADEMEMRNHGRRNHWDRNHTWTCRSVNKCSD